MGELNPTLIRIMPLKGDVELSFKQPDIYLSLGVRGAGKSAFLEAIGEHQLYNGNTILDLFASSDGENLAWLRSQWVEEYKPLLIISESLEIDADYDMVRWSEFKLSYLKKYRIIISSRPLYSNDNEQFKAVNYLLDLLFSRYGWRKYVYLLIRETANIFYSRMKKAENQLLAKSEATYLIRESRHHGLALGMDTQRFFSVDIDLRSLADYVILKRMGFYSLPRELWWVYRYVKPSWIQRMHPKYFVLITNNGDLALGEFRLPQWHKRPKEHILKLLNIKIKIPELA